MTPIQIFQSVTVLFVAMTFYWVDFALIRRFDTKRSGAGSGRSWDFTLLMLLCILVLILQPILLPVLSLTLAFPWNVVLPVFGILFLIAGFILHFWARRHLQVFYAERVEIQPEHQIIRTGPYASIRHPVFTSFFLLVTGLLLVNLSLPNLAMVVYTFWDFTHAARQEEELLGEKLPGYREYMQQTTAFFPRIGGH